MSTFSAGPDKEAQLARRMLALGVQESDIEESFIRSGGHGGQNVNKTSTCVMLLHRPTGFQVKCQTTRHQGLNRMLARQLLLDKIESERKSAALAERSRIEKLRRQKRPRSRSAKERILADKSHRSARKRSRGPIERD
jgi:protein subunit release factor B